MAINLMKVVTVQTLTVQTTATKMTLDEWITKYEDKAEKYIRLPGFHLYFEPDKGFFLWRVIGDVFEVEDCCTNDFRYFTEVSNSIAKGYGCRTMRTCNTRNPVAFWRMYGYPSINWSLSGIRPNGKFYMVYEMEVY